MMKKMLKKTTKAFKPDNSSTTVCASDNSASVVDNEDAPAVWHGAEGSPAFLCVTVKEARNLIAKDYSTASSDPYARVLLGGVAKKTRVLYHTLNPMWQESLLLPLNRTAPESELVVELLDKDFASVDFLGSVSLSLARVFALVQSGACEAGGGVWLTLQKRKATDEVSGDVCLSFDLLSAEEGATAAKAIAHDMDPETIAARLASKALHVRLHGLNAYQRSGIPRKQEKVSLYIRIGRLMVHRPLPLTDSLSGEYDLTIKEDAVVQLKAAMEPPPTAGRRRDELFDVKLYIKTSTLGTVAKAQIPIWSIPIYEESKVAGDGHGGGQQRINTLNSALGTPTSERSFVEASFKLEDKQLLDDKALLDALTVQPGGLSVSNSHATDPGVLTTHVQPSGLSESGYGTGGSGMLHRPSAPSAPSTPPPPSIDQGLDHVSTRSSPVGSPGDRDSESFAFSTSSRDKATTGSNEWATNLKANLRDRHQMIQAKLKKDMANVGKMLMPAAACTTLTLTPNWSPSADHNILDEVGTPRAGDLDSLAPGKRFSRVMEPWVPLHESPEVIATFKFMDVTADPNETAPVAELDNTDDDDDDIPGAAPLIPPAPLDVSCVDTDIAMGVNRLFGALFSTNSEAVAKMLQQEGLRDHKVGPWTADPSGGAVKMRGVSYIKPLKIPLPMAPKEAAVTEEQKVLVKEDGGFVVELKVETQAPKGDTFYVLVQVFGTTRGVGQSHLRVTVKVVFTKSVFGKMIIQSGGENDSKRFWAVFVAIVKEQAGTTITGGQANVPGAAPLGQAAFVSTAKPPSTFDRAVKVAHAALLLVLVILLIVLIAGVYRVGSTLSRELSLMTSTMRAVLEDAGSAGRCQNPQ